MKEIQINVRIQDTNTDILETVTISKEEIEQIACNKAREEYPKKRMIFAEGICNINFM